MGKKESGLPTNIDLVVTQGKDVEVVFDGTTHDLPGCLRSLRDDFRAPPANGGHGCQDMAVWQGGRLVGLVFKDAAGNAFMYEVKPNGVVTRFTASRS